MRIAIDGRKLRDYGIGTYVRNLLRQLGAAGHRQRVRRVLPRAPTATRSRSWARGSAPSSSRPGRIRSRNSSRSRWISGAKAVELFHAPHYVLPPLTPCRSVVTIHDCIHLRFPQYLPSKLGYAYARAQMWAATHQAARVITVSEASKRDILRYFRVPESRIDVIYNAIDDRFWEEPTADEIDAGARALPAHRSVRALRRQHQAAQEPRAPDRGVPPDAPRRTRTCRTCSC